jgi:hypothetical protein
MLVLALIMTLFSGIFEGPYAAVVLGVFAVPLSICSMHFGKDADARLTSKIKAIRAAGNKVRFGARGADSEIISFKDLDLWDTILYWHIVGVGLWLFFLHHEFWFYGWQLLGISAGLVSLANRRRRLLSGAETKQS